MEVVIIVAMSTNRVIGSGPDIPWHVPEDLARFKKVTMGHPLIMGRKTFESIGKPLPGRRNIILTRNRNYAAEGCDVVFSLKEAFELCAENEKIFVIGGEQIFAQALPFTTTIILTTILREVDGDVHFPEFNGFERVSIEKKDGTEPFTIEVFKKNNFYA